MPLTTPIPAVQKPAASRQLPRLPYSPPVVKRYGTLTTLTQSTGTNPTDVNSMGSK